MAEASHPSRLQSILVASDVSPRADRAVLRAAQLAQEHEATLTVLSVVEPRPHDAEQEVTTSEHELRQHVATLTATAEGTVTTRVTTGTPFVEIIRGARAVAADLTIVGAHGANFMKDMFFGTTAEKIVRKGDRSVLVVKQLPQGAYARVVAAVDFTPASRQALAFALRLAPRAEVYVVHVYKGFEGQLRRASLSEADIMRYRRERAKEVRAELATFLQDFSGATQPMRRIVKAGVPFYDIVQTAKRRRADLLVVGTTGRTGLPYILLGSVAARVVREAPCDVLVVRSGPVRFELP